MASLGRKLTVCLRLILLLLPGSKMLGLPADNTENKKLEELEEQFYHFGLRQYPELATHIGEHAHDDLLESFTMETFRARKLECSALLVRSHRIAMSRLPPDRRKDLLILRKSLETVIDGFRWRTYGNLNSISFLGFAIKGPIWVASAKFKSQSDYQKYLTRLKSLPVQVRDRTALMNLAIALNRTSHRVSVEKVPSLMGYESHRSLLWRPFLSRPSDIPQRRWKEMIDEATYLIDSELKSAYDELHNFLLLEYIPSSRRTEGVLSWDGGTEYYTACLKWYVGEAVSPHYIHGLGLSEVRRMKDLINKNVLTRIGFNGSLAEFFDHVMSIPDFFNHSADLLLSKYSGLINNQIHGKLFNLFKRVYVPNVRIVQRSFYGPWGSYGANTFFLNSMESEKRSTLDMMPLALHEVNPGHHFQVAYSSQFPLPKYRDRHVFGELYAVPFLMPSHQAYIEGWALYAEYLGEEMGLFSDPYLLFGRYCSEMFRACRMVVDTGIHALGWSRQQAIEYIAAHTMFPPRQIAMEVDRYITWPGQSVAYKMGELKIRQLRKLAEGKLGAHFGIKEFHDQILRHGRVPLDILEGIVHDWIKSRSRDRLRDFDQKSDRTPMAAKSSSFCDKYYQMCSLTYIVLFSLLLS